MPLKLEFARCCSKSISRIALFSTRTLHRLNQAIPPKISSRAIRRVSRPFHHVCRIIIIQLLGKRQIFHSIWNRLNTKGNTPGCLIQGTKLKYKIRPRWTRFPLATHTCGGVRIALWINGVPPRMCPDIHLFVYLCKFCARSLFPFSLNKLGAGLAAQINYGLIN